MPITSLTVMPPIDAMLMTAPPRSFIEAFQAAAAQGRVPGDDMVARRLRTLDKHPLIDKDLVDFGR
jgi:hypothetical protein